MNGSRRVQPDQQHSLFYNKDNNSHDPMLLQCHQTMPFVFIVLIAFLWQQNLHTVPLSGLRYTSVQSNCVCMKNCENREQQW